jgi:dTDP-D-glucose 4,6-dehydratase
MLAVADNSFGNSMTFTKNNVLGTHSLLEVAKANSKSIKLFIHVSTDEVYGEGSSGVASSEHTEMDPTNPYSASKAGAEHLVKAYRRSFGLPIIITRGNNVYGPHQFPEKIVPKFISQLVSTVINDAVVVVAQCRVCLAEAGEEDHPPRQRPQHAQLPVR